jgi:hypothetical protein
VTAPSALRVDPSRFLLLDLGDVLARNAPQLWEAVAGRREPSAGDLRTAYALLRDTWADTVTGASWLDALRGVWDERDAVWGETAEGPSYAVDLARGTMDGATLRAALVHALPQRTDGERQEPQPPFAAPKLDPRPSTRYVVRCAYRRPACGPLHPDVVSDPSPPFAIAGFFDLDAPARPVHITLPVDTSIAGLRKAPKNVRMVISRELRQQLQRVTDLDAVMKKEVAAGESFDLGMICSFSIPIITICALVVLLIFLSLLNIVFWWMPFFRICFPVPVRRS